MKRLAIAAVGLALVVGLVGNPPGGTATPASASKVHGAEAV
jgi:hypothetical protein